MVRSSRTRNIRPFSNRSELRSSPSVSSTRMALKPQHNRPVAIDAQISLVREFTILRSRPRPEPPPPDDRVEQRRLRRVLAHHRAVLSDQRADRHRPHVTIALSEEFAVRGKFATRAGVNPLISPESLGNPRIIDFD